MIINFIKNNDETHSIELKREDFKYVSEYKSPIFVYNRLDNGFFMIVSKTADKIIIYTYVEGWESCKEVRKCSDLERLLDTIDIENEILNYNINFHCTRYTVHTMTISKV